MSLVVRDASTMGGIARYTHELARGLAESEVVDARIVPIGVAGVWPGRVEPAVERLRGPLGGSFAVLRAPVRATDVVHFVTHESYPVFAALRAPVVMTIHSVEPMFLGPAEVHGGHAPRLWRLPYHLLRLARSRVCLFIVPSATTGRELAHHLRVPQERILVIPHGVSPIFFRDHGRFRLSGDEPYVLHVSNHQPQKNVVRLIEAFATLDDSVQLVIAGDTSRCGAQYADAIARAGVADRVHLVGTVRDDAAIAALYRGALVHAMPSLHESFGLPVLEAAACGCPSIVGRGTGAEETGGPSALAVDARSVSEIASALSAILGECALRERLASAGPAHAQTFTWDRSVALHEQAYLEAMT